MGEEKCLDSRSWEEEMYWNHFQFIHFAQTLNSDFDQQLAIPEHFSKNLKKKLPDIVTLKGPSGCKWEVRLKTDDDIVFFRHGWNEFVKDHSLKEKDFLVFKYNGDSRFDVVVFDGESLCEKASAYFVRKVACIENGSGFHEKRKSCENSGEGSRQDVNPDGDVGDVNPDGDVNPGPSLGMSADNDVIDTPPLNRPIKSKTSRKKPCKPVTLSEPTWEWHAQENRDWPLQENGQHSFCTDEIETKPDVVQISLSSSPVYDVPFISSRRFVTEYEKQNALQSAIAASSDSGFVQVMKPTSVLRKFYLVIPSGWINRHLNALLAKDVILRINQNTWRTKFLYQKSRNSGGLSSGWRSFVMDNNLQEFDACVFEPGNPINDTLVLDVKIFRVLPETVASLGQSEV